MMPRKQFPPLIFLIIYLSLQPLSSSSSLSSFSPSNSPWHPSQNNQTLLSHNSIFAAGFIKSPISPTLFIFAVWYSQIPNHTDNVVWSANWDSPVQSSASLIITSSGDLRLINGSSGPNLWPATNSSSTGSSLNLTDEGSLVFGSWRSFDHPTDTILPNQTITNDIVLISKNGKYKFSGSKDLVFNGSDTYWSSDSAFVRLGLDGVLLKSGGGQLYASDYNQTRTRRLTLGDDGVIRVLSYYPERSKWVIVWESFPAICQVHGLCGPVAICYSDGSTETGYECQCPPGFKWSSKPVPDSCERKTPMNMMDPSKTKFLRLDYVNYSGGSDDLKLFNFNECESKCKSDRTCLGFGFKYDGSGYCVLQHNHLLNGYWSPATETAFYLRVDRTEPDPTNYTGMSDVLRTACPIQIGLPNPPDESSDTARNIAIISVLFTIEIASGVLLFWAFLKRYVKYRDMAQTLGLGLLPTAGPKRFTYAEIRAATNDFSNENLIGRGGFSDVYAGNLKDGRPVAVKCLKGEVGGDTEFWAEVTIIARMHHLNLVRLWGFCNEKGRRILVYEHVPNGSLDRYLFRPVQSRTEEEGEQKEAMFDWNVRYRIALGVARAIAYLHEECLEWVLHCDIKPENILLGDDFCPKVADFGLSKLRKKEQLVTLSHIRGTRGYLAPEWLKNDPLTSKVDVYSFGMVLLEVVTGTRNSTQRHSSLESHEWYAPQWAFEMAIEERNMEEILDRRIKDCYDGKVHFEMVDRMVKTAMWCVQERPEVRPSMGKVAKMLEGTVEILPPPKPAFFDA